ncbi:hypothetical protein EJ06DRAFT_558311 [Trichodelitschia bisporula]|uniref:C2H2-type domain-containing protein n=1 Tax=Trichodelitschia bisporula TaxID=703511 RepID=A0A6G1HRE6_9PEZI|nr:hypothetical protein EJ06DRAFT_558311 [Trichodelitschia bisporula]
MCTGGKKTEKQCYRCKNCGSVFGNSIALDQHLRTKHGKSNTTNGKPATSTGGKKTDIQRYRREKCWKDFDSSGARDQHAMTTHGKLDTTNGKQTTSTGGKKIEKQCYHCEECGKDFGTSNVRKQHVRTKRGRSDTKPDTTNGKPTTSTDGKKIEKESYCCEGCGMSFGLFRALDQHELVMRYGEESEESEFDGLGWPTKCHICGEQCYSTFTLQEHIWVKHDKRGGPKSDFDLKSRTEEKKPAVDGIAKKASDMILCGGCEKKLSDFAALKDHCRRHMRDRHDRPNACLICGNDFASASVWVQHVSTEHGELDNPDIKTTVEVVEEELCRCLCGKLFGSAKALGQHQRSEGHGGDDECELNGIAPPPVGCPHCGEKFSKWLTHRTLWTRSESVDKNLDRKSRTEGKKAAVKGVVEKASFVFQCTHCDEKFDHKALHEHWEDIIVAVPTQFPISKCPNCNKEFSDFETFVVQWLAIYKRTLAPWSGVGGEDSRVPSMPSPPLGGSDDFDSKSRTDGTKAHEAVEKSSASQRILCIGCDVRFSDFAAFAHHWEAIHKDPSTPFPCTRCDIELPDMQNLGDHWKTFHSYLIVCMRCDKDFSGFGTYDDHWKVAHNDPILCTRCDKEIPDILAHLDAMHGGIAAMLSWMRNEEGRAPSDVSQTVEENTDSGSKEGKKTAEAVEKSYLAFQLQCTGCDKKFPDFCNIFEHWDAMHMGPSAPLPWANIDNNNAHSKPGSQAATSPEDDMQWRDKYKILEEEAKERKEGEDAKTPEEEDEVVFQRPTLIQRPAVVKPPVVVERTATNCRTCPECHKWFAQPEHMKQHRRDAHTSTKCPRCRKILKTVEGKEQHMRDFHRAPA